MAALARCASALATTAGSAIAPVRRFSAAAAASSASSFELPLRLNNIGPNKGATRDRKRVGRGIGSGTGKTCGKGHKGSKARKGTKRPGFEGGQTPFHRRIPKRGFKNGYVKENARQVSCSWYIVYTAYLVHQFWSRTTVRACWVDMKPFLTVAVCRTMDSALPVALRVRVETNLVRPKLLVTVLCA